MQNFKVIHRKKCNISMNTSPYKNESISGYMMRLLTLRDELGCQHNQRSRIGETDYKRLHT